MNAISVTMVKGPNQPTLHGFALRQMTTMVTLSWLGLQMLIISGCYAKKGVANRPQEFLIGAAVLLLISFFAFLRLKRRDASPTREAAQVFFVSFLLALPLLTWGMWRYVAHIQEPLKKFFSLSISTSEPLAYACLVVSAVYAAVIVLWLTTHVPAYDFAKPQSFAAKVVRRFELWVIEPYFKN